MESGKQHVITLGSYFAYALALAIAAVIPGPGIAAIVGKSLGAGFRATIPMVTGLVLGDLLYLSLAVLGLALIAETFSGLFTVIRFLGAGYLLYLAWSFWRVGIVPTEVTAGRRDNAWITFLSGFAVTLGNPKTIIFYMALVPVVIDVRAVDGVDFGVLAVITVLVLYVGILPYVALASRARGWLQSPSALRVVNRVAATALGSAAAAIALRNN